MKKALLALFSLFIFPLLFAGSVLAQETVSGNNVVLPSGQTVNQDYFAAGETVTVSGTVNGDAYVAGGNVVFDGTVNGDLLVAGGTVTVRGRVANDLRIAGGEVYVAGNIGGSVSAAGGSVRIADGANVGGSLAVAAGNLQVFAPVGRGASLAGGQVLLSSRIGGNVSAGVEQLVLAPGAQVNGNLNYWSNRQVQVQSGAQVTGSTTQHIPPQREARPEDIQRSVAGAFTTFNLLYLLSYLVVGLLFIRFLPVFTQGVTETLRNRPWASLLVGLIALILTPILLLILAVTLIGLPIAFILFVIYLILIYMSKVFISLAIGQLALRLFNRRPSMGWALLVGVVIYGILTFIPVIGGLTWIIATIFGVGAILIAKKNYYRTLRSKDLI